MKKTCEEKIVQALRANNIGCSFDRGTGLVLVRHRGRLGEFYSIYYCFEEGRVSNFSIYTLAVPESKYREMENFLSKLNKPASSLYFYVDDVTGCIALNNEYELSETEGDEMEGLSTFCVDTHKICIDYQVLFDEALKRVGTGCDKVFSLRETLRMDA